MDAWIAPFIEGNTPVNDERLANKILQVYKKSANIIIDAVGDGNFLGDENELTCVDMDLAVNYDSDVSNEIIRGVVNNKPTLEKYLSNFTMLPKSVAMIKTLLYLEQQIDHTDIPKEYLTSILIDKLHLFRELGQAITVEKMRVLWVLIQLDHQNTISNQEITPDLVRILEWHLAKRGEFTLQWVQSFIARHIQAANSSLIKFTFMGVCDRLPGPCIPAVTDIPSFNYDPSIAELEDILHCRPVTNINHFFTPSATANSSSANGTRIPFPKMA